MFLKELILNSFYIGMVCWSCERTDFEQFLLWEGVLVSKELIVNSFYIWEGVKVVKEMIFNSF